MVYLIDRFLTHNLKLNNKIKYNYFQNKKKSYLIISLKQ